MPGASRGETRVESRESVVVVVVVVVVVFVVVVVVVVVVVFNAEGEGADGGQTGTTDIMTTGLRATRDCAY